MKLTLYTVIITLFAFINANAQAPEKWFGSDYSDAIEQCKREIDWIIIELSQSDIPAKVGLSVVFPEMLRYSPTRNMMEASALKMLYVTDGKPHANFSIGWMQMKPSFAERLEELIKAESGLNSKYKKLISYESLKQKEIRKERVRRLDDFWWQLKYLSAFVDLQNKRFAISKLPEKEMIKILATSYNYGLDKSYNEVIKYSSKKNFPNGPKGNSPYNYYWLSEYFYLNNADELFKNIEQ